MRKARPYHHGDLRQAVVAAAVSAIEESGPANISLRDLARRAGVSHAAPAHHFKDKTGMLTAVATQGYELLADGLSAVKGGLVDLGVEYVRFAIHHRAHFEVMFRPELYRADDPALMAASSRAIEALYAGVRALSSKPARNFKLGAVAAWSLVHGFATLWLNGALPAELGKDPEAAARSVAELLFHSPSAWLSK